MRTDRFFSVPRTVHNTSAGLVDLPILYYDVRNVMALFSVEVEAAAKVLAEADLEPAIVRGKAVVGASFYEYRRTTVGVYNEVGTAIFALRHGEQAPFSGLVDLLRAPERRRVGAYVVDLPVTTREAWAAGREIWGYPKFITQIPFELEKDRVKSSVRDPDDGSTICELAGTLGGSVPAPPLSLMTYTRLAGALVRTKIEVRGRVKLHAPGNVVQEVGSSAHRMAQNLRTLGLDGARPRLVMVTDRFQSKLFAGSRVDG